MSWYEDPRADVLVRLGSADGGSLHVAHLGRLVGDVAWGRSAREGRRVDFGARVAVKTTVKGSPRSFIFRVLEIDPKRTVDELWHGNLYVKGHFAEVERETNPVRAEVAWRIWPVRERCLRQLPGYVDPRNVEVFWDGDDRWMIELERPGFARLRVRAASEEEVENEFEGELSQHLAAWEAAAMDTSGNGTR